MHRRTALRQLAILLGGVALTPELMAGTLSRATSGELPATLSPETMAILAEIAETIIPETDTPGAKQAGVPAFIALVVEDCVGKDEKQAFWAGLDAVERTSLGMYGISFTQCDAAQRTALLKKTEQEAKTQSGPNFWRMVKGLTLFGYFSSEIGMTQALAFDPIPGEWIPEMPIDNNTKAWAGMF